MCRVRVSLFLCLALSACSPSPEYRVTGADSLSGLSVSDGGVSRFVAFSGIVVEPLYQDPRYDSECRLPDVSAFVQRAFSGKTVSLDEARGMRIDDESPELLLVRAGYAVPDMLSPALPARGSLERAAAEARKSERGIWDPCPAYADATDSWALVGIPVDAPASSVVEAGTGDSVTPDRSKSAVETPFAEKLQTPPEVRSILPEATPTPPTFSCDPARKTCKAMKSCAEAKYFLANCGTKGMDGDKDGVPCEALCKGK